MYTYGCPDIRLPILSEHCIYLPVNLTGSLVLLSRMAEIDLESMFQLNVCLDFTVVFRFQRTSEGIFARPDLRSAPRRFWAAGALQGRLQDWLHFAARTQGVCQNWRGHVSPKRQRPFQVRRKLSLFQQQTNRLFCSLQGKRPHQSPPTRCGTLILLICGRNCTIGWRGAPPVLSKRSGSEQ